MGPGTGKQQQSTSSMAHQQQQEEDEQSDLFTKRGNRRSLLPTASQFRAGNDTTVKLI